MCIKVFRFREFIEWASKFDQSFKVNLLPQRINEHVQILYVPVISSVPLRAESVLRGSLRTSK
jgi:hypothetical protein